MVDEVVGGNTEVSEKLLSPIKKNSLWILSISIYFILLSVAGLFLKSYLPNRIELLSSTYFSISFAILLLIIVASISISIFVGGRTYRSFPKALIFFGVFFGVFIFLNLFWLKEALNYTFVAVGLILFLLFRLHWVWGEC